MDIQIARGAEREFNEAYLRYEIDREGLGAEFLEEIARTIKKIARHPMRWPLILEDVRRGLPKRFPYAVFYQCHKDYIYIVAIMHTSRRPGYWRGRVTKK